MTTLTTMKCAHPACSCHVSDKNYCSDKCQAAAKESHGKCPCEHPGCEEHH